ncbi:hypothetical protein GCM10028805_55420 [Spirosoma harenae]
MKVNHLQKSFFVLVSIGSLFLSGCGHTSVRPHVASATVGAYQLTQYTTESLADNQPKGTIRVDELTSEVINITITGAVGKTPFNYFFENVDVVFSGQNAFDQDMYVLLYNDEYIGQAGSDGLGRFIEVYPTSQITLRAAEY